jgi:integrase
MRRRNRVPGCIFLNNGRYWWRVKLPGEEKLRARPLIPPGSGFATADPGVAEDVARDMYARAVFEHGQSDVLRQPRRENRPQIRSVAGLVREYLAHARRYYVSPDGQQSGEADRIAIAMRPLIEHCPALPVERFGPLALKDYRDRMIEADLCRSYVNKRVNMVRRMFRWAVEEELVPPSVFHGLQAVMGLRRGRSGAREGEPVRPIAEAWVRRTMEFMQPVVAAMVELQMLTGMRPGEVCILRPMDVDRRGKVWLYTPADHKTAHHGHKRVVPIGPRGQEVLRPFLTRPRTIALHPTRPRPSATPSCGPTVRPACSRRSRTAASRILRSFPATGTTRTPTATPSSTPLPRLTGRSRRLPRPRDAR